MDTTSFDRLRSTSFRAGREHRYPNADTKRYYGYAVNDVMLRINDVTPYGVNDVAFGKQCSASHKRCGLTPNEVALRANIWYNL